MDQPGYRMLLITYGVIWIPFFASVFTIYIYSAMSGHIRITKPKPLFQHNALLPDLDALIEPLRDGCYRPNTLNRRCNFIRIQR